MKLFTLFALAFSTMAHANLHLAPPDFSGNIFVDFKTANYKLDYNFKRWSLTATSVIEFEAKNSGYPIIDLIPDAESVVLDNQETSLSEISAPGNVTKYKRVNLKVSPGTHRLVVVNKIKKHVFFNFFGVSSAFWIRDLKDRMFLEQYIPSNLEFDQYQMTFDVNYSNKRRVRQDIFTNGQVTEVSDSRFIINFPAYFTVSCPYYHTTRKGALPQRTYTYASISGREIPVKIYSRRPWAVKRFTKYASQMLQELEHDYGPWGHPELLVFAAGLGGGMEHSGATMTTYGALDHEMLHSYFAKGVMPASGNSGWIDEAIASWRDHGYPSIPYPTFIATNMGAHSLYQRKTDTKAYHEGAEFMSYLDYRLSRNGGLKAFLRGYFEAYKHTVITVDHFRKNLEFFIGEDLSDEFNQFVLNNSKEASHESNRVNPVHGPAEANDLDQMLIETL